MPRFLLRIIYKEKNYHIGDLNALIVKEKSDILDEEIRNITQIPLDITLLVNALIKNASKIDSIEYCADPQMRVFLNGKQSNIEEALKTTKATVKELTF